MLQSLELFGFKSFADRVKFEFDPGITCVVGPNGSGKSNVVDAIKWLLGDQSAKSLRGSEMADVIFNGSAARGGSAYAEAVLTFDNESGLIPFAAREVAVGRRLYRTGESEYLLNGEAVRLKDIRSLFLGTGAGTAAYSIIEQGRVGQILQANPAARRAVFEEAAGVAKFKARRTEAERRLARVASNLERLTDIVDDTETRLAATRSQASKAAKYRELTLLLKDQWLGLAGDHYRTLTARITNLTTQDEQDEAREGGCRTEVERAETEAKRLRRDLETAERELTSCETKASHTRETLAGLRSTLKAQDQQAASVQNELRRIAAESWRERLSLQERSTELAQAKENVLASGAARSSLADEEALVRDRIESLEAARLEAEQTRDEHSDRLIGLETERVELLNEQRDRDQRLAVVDSRSRQLEKEQAEVESTLAESILEVDRRREAAALVDHEQALVRDRVAEIRSEETTLKEQLDQTRSTIAAAREDQSAAEARLAVLRDLEQTIGGALSVAEIIKRAETSHEEPWASILGRVGDLIDCTVENAPLVDLALGSRAHLIATTDLSSLIEHLAADPLDFEGRVGFLEIGSSRRGTLRRQSARGRSASQEFFAELNTLYSEADLGDPSDEPGVMGRIDQYVQAQTTLAAAVLGDTWLVDHIARAYELQSTYAGCRFITPYGELIDSDGTAYFGELSVDASVVGRRAELRELRARVSHHRRTLQDATKRFEVLEAQRAELRQALEQEQSHQPKAVERASRSQLSLRSAIERLESSRDRLEAVEAEALELQEEQAELRVSCDQLSARLNQCAAQHQATTKLISDAEDSAYRISRERAAAEQELRDLALQAAKISTRHDAETDRLARLQADVDQTATRVERMRSHASELTERHSEFVLSILNARAARDTRTLEHEHQHQLLTGLRQARRKISEALDGIRHHHRQAEAELRDVTSRRARCAVELREAHATLDRLAERCDEDFSISLADAAETPSAYEAFCQSLPEDVERPGFDDVAESLEQEAQRTRRKIKKLGSVNTESLRDLDELETRFETLSGQLADLLEAKRTLEEIIARTNVESRRLFSETFETVRGHFQELFRKCFGGGSADLVLEEAEDILDSGIDILARPPGKELRNLSLLSGGEKAMTAVALLMALFRAKPSPYCILDEVDAPLDEANIDRFLNVLRDFREGTQFVIITHRRRTMTSADVIYGVTMETSGVSKKLAVNVNDVADDGSVKQAA